VSTLADWVGAATATLMPLVTAILIHVFAGERIHADDTTVPVLAKVKTRTGRLGTYVRDDRPFAGPDPPAAVFFYSRDRGGEHPTAFGQLSGIDAGGTPMPASTGCTKPTASQGRSSRPPTAVHLPRPPRSQRRGGIRPG
jgi:hypothetical protein